MLQYGELVNVYLVVEDCLIPLLVVKHKLSCQVKQFATCDDVGTKLSPCTYQELSASSFLGIFQTTSAAFNV